MKVANTKTVESLIDCSQKYNRYIPRGVKKDLDPEGRHVFSVILVHEHIAGKLVEPHYRCSAFLKMKDADEPAHFYVDMSIDDYDSLMDHEEYLRLLKEADSGKAVKDAEETPVTV